ncbi:hypothetical protein GCM10009803_09220 [Microbacterium ginsengiterrae]
MSVRTVFLDLLGQPSLLPAREKARAVQKRIVGITGRLRLKSSKNTIPGMLSIVVPMYGVERYIGDCLQSLLIQDYANIQVIVVDDGSPDRSYEVAREYAKRDPRIHIVRQANGGLSSARNTGARHARGEYLAFLDSDDFVDRHTYREAIEALRASGSDFSVSPYRREKNGSFSPAAAWIRDAHRTTRLGLTLREFPDIMVNAVAWSKVYKRSFWEENDFVFPVGLLYEDQAVSMAAYAAARSFDVLSRVSINWRIRGDQSSITQQITSPRNIADHAVAVQHSLAALLESGHPDARRVRVQQILNNNLREFLPNIRQMDETAWSQFRMLLKTLADVAEPETWDLVEVRIKVLVELCLRDRRDEALQFLSEGGWERDHFAGTVQGHELIADLPLSTDVRESFPDWTLRYGPQETALTAVVRDVDVSERAVSIDALVYINHLRMDSEDTTLTCHIIAPSGERVEPELRRHKSAKYAYGHTRRYADMSGCAVTLSLPREMLTSLGSYSVEFEMSCGELVRQGELIVDGLTKYGRAFTGGRNVSVAVESDGKSAKIVARRADVELVDCRADGDAATLRLQSAAPVTHVFLVRRDDRFALKRSRTRLTDLGNGSFEAEVRLPRLRGVAGGGAHEYLLKAEDQRGDAYDVALYEPLKSSNPARAYITPYLHRSNEQGGGAMIVDLADAALITGVKIEDDSLQLEYRDEQTSARLASVTARVGSSSVTSQIDKDGVTTRVVLPLQQDLWGLGPSAVPSGRYHLQGMSDRGGNLSFYVSGDVASSLPLELDHPLLRAVIGRSKRGHLHLDIQPPLRDDERGGGDRWRLRDWAMTLRPRGHRSVLFRNLYGEAANDSALAVHRELQRRGSDLELIWAVKDLSIHVPQGARPVIEESREYYEAFGTADYVMLNVHQPYWYEKPAGQVLIETFHGYPFKLNGRRWWRHLGFTPERQESFFRRAEEWDFLVSPARYATPILEEFYREDAAPSTTVLEIGYPRNDALLDENAAAVRSDTRRRLGIPPNKKAILYAPTFRDYLSADDMTAKLVDLFDPEDLIRRLGPDYVLLMRGHPFNARSGTKRSEAFINVTDYPDINHLILASDVGVLDYSSLRFDYALTGKPVFYFVPDLERYFEGRTGFVSYSDTSPGPHIRRVEDLVDGIRQAGEVAAEFDRARERFVSTFMELEDGHAARRLVDAVFAPRGDA